VTDHNDDRAEMGETGRPGWKKENSDSAGEARTGGASRSDSDRPARSGSDRGGRSDRSPRDSGRPERGSDRRGSRDSGSRPNFPRDDRPGRAGEGREGTPRPDWQTRVERPRDPERAKSPMIPEEITENDLDLLVRVQMKTLSPENAERVARHLAMVNLLIDEDPELAHQHAIAAADRAGRIGIVRETLALTAYTVGDFALALRELQAYRRISGKDDQLPIMVDCERGLGRPDKALELGRSVPREKLDVGVRVNLAIAMSGARLDKAQFDLALSELEIPELNPASVFDYSPHLFRAYAHTLEILGRVDESAKWHVLADRATEALEAKNAPAIETVKVIEELIIPDAYPSREERDSRPSREGDRPRRDLSDRPPRGGDRPHRDGDRPSREGDRPSRDGNRPNRDGGRPNRDIARPAREDRPRDDRPRDDRPREDKPKRDRYAGGFRIDHLDKPNPASGASDSQPRSTASEDIEAPKAKWKKNGEE